MTVAIVTLGIVVVVQLAVIVGLIYLLLHSLRRSTGMKTAKESEGAVQPKPKFLFGGGPFGHRPELKVAEKQQS